MNAIVFSLVLFIAISVFLINVVAISQHNWLDSQMKNAKQSNDVLLKLSSVNVDRQQINSIFGELQTLSGGMMIPRVSTGAKSMPALIHKFN
mmetsp:Transcript_5724/g.6717  ORF Transcript_5724/g.6717 Transcript_5724/m.6717 type:complete len:92 (-) Transcript_5724:3-278(-)